MIRQLVGLLRGRDLGGVCPVCGRYDWPERPWLPQPCSCGGHDTRTCECGFSVTLPERRPDCD